jgi:hypothetical protein
MDPTGTIDRVVQIIGSEVASVTATLVPVGAPLTVAFITLAVLFLALAIGLSATSMLAPMVATIGRATVTVWAVAHWATITMDTLHASRRMIGLMVGGYSGPSALFTMANGITARILTEYISVSLWSPSTWADPLFGAMAALLVWVGLTVTAVLAVLAEFELLIGAAVAPLILPAMAFGVSGSLGFTPVRFLLNAAVRVVIMGTMSVIMSRAVTSVIDLSPAGQSMTHEEILTLLGIAVLTALVGLRCNGLANGIVGGTPGVMGWQALTSMASSIASSVSTVGSMGGTALAGAANAAGSARAAAGRAVGTTSRITQSATSGSAFRS